MKKLFAVILALFLFGNIALALEVPNYTNWVNDFANVIDDQIEDQLNNKISDYEKKTTNEIAVVTIPSLEGESLEDFSIRLAENWKPGKEEKDNGIILLFAVQEKRVRLEVGYGLEGIINDAKAGRILDDYVVEYKNAGDFTKAAENGVEGIIKTIGEEPWQESQSGQIPEDVLLWIVIIIIGLVVFFVIWKLFEGGIFSGGSSGRSSSNSSGFGGFSGGSFGGGGASR